MHACMHALMATVVSLPLLVSTTAKADVTYTYTGNNYTIASGVWTTAMQTIITATFSSQPIGVVDLQTDALLTGFTWDDGAFSFASMAEWLDSSLPPIGGSSVIFNPVATMTFDGSGDVTDWLFDRLLITTAPASLELTSDNSGEFHLLNPAEGESSIAFPLAGGTWEKVETTPASTPSLWSAALLVITTGLLWRRSKAKAEMTI